MGHVETLDPDRSVVGQNLTTLPPVTTLLSPLLRDMRDLGLASSDPMDATACPNVNAALVG